MLTVKEFLNEERSRPNLVSFEDDEKTELKDFYTALGVYSKYGFDPGNVAKTELAKKKIKIFKKDIKGSEAYLDIHGDLAVVTAAPHPDYPDDGPGPTLIKVNKKGKVTIDFDYDNLDGEYDDDYFLRVGAKEKAALAKAFKSFGVIASAKFDLIKVGSKKTDTKDVAFAELNITKKGELVLSAEDDDGIANTVKL